MGPDSPGETASYVRRGTGNRVGCITTQASVHPGPADDAWSETTVSMGEAQMRVADSAGHVRLYVLSVLGTVGISYFGVNEAVFLLCALEGRDSRDA